MHSIGSSEDQHANVTPESDGRRRKTPSEVADALSQTISPDPECAKDSLSDSLGDIIDDQDGKPKWIWRDMKGGYAELLRLRKIQEDDATNLDSKSVEYSANPPNKDSFEEQLDALATKLVKTIAKSKYQESEWYREIWIALTRASDPSNFDRVQVARLKRCCNNSEVIGDDLFFRMIGARKKCVTLQGVSEVIRNTLDKKGRWKSCEEETSSSVLRTLGCGWPWWLPWKILPFKSD